MGGTPSPSHNTSTGLMSFLGGTPVPDRGYPSARLGGTPSWGIPWPGQVSDRVYPKMGYPLARDGVPPARSGWGTTPPARSGWGTPQPWMGYFPGIEYTWTGYAVDGTPLAVSHRRTLLIGTIFVCNIGIVQIELRRASETAVQLIFPQENLATSRESELTSCLTQCIWVSLLKLAIVR